MQLVDKRALIDVELLLLSQAKEQAEQARLDEHEQRWRNFQSVAPPAVMDYVWAIDADIVADRQTFDSDSERWFYRNHPLFEYVLQGLHAAVRKGFPNRLSLTQAWMLKYAQWTLAWAYAKDRQPKTGGVWYDATVRELAAHDLLGWTDDQSHPAWEQPLRYLEQWRIAATDNAETLERAGLHQAELQLLDAHEEGEIT